MYAVLHWENDAPAEQLGTVIKENVTYEEAVVIAGMNPDQHHREIITMEEREKMRKCAADGE